MDLFDIFQQFRIERNKSRVNEVGRQASDASFEAGRASLRVTHLEDKVD